MDKQYNTKDILKIKMTSLDFFFLITYMYSEIEKLFRT
jgi:hypothetical protein